jgi:DNA-binding transcriptional regulator YiaG
VGAAGALLAEFDQLDALMRDQRARAARARQQQRALPEPPTPAEVCGCGLAVGRWTGRETRALREALRMSMRMFAEHLGVSVAAVSGWEHPMAPAPPRLARQAVLDSALNLADADARTRSGLILTSTPHELSGTARSAAGTVVELISGSPESP